MSVFRKSSSKRPPKLRRRTVAIETLERRELLTGFWQNPSRQLDVNNDTFLSPIDALLVINHLNNPANSSRVGERVNPLDSYLDTNGDDFVSPIDVLLIVNGLNSTYEPPFYASSRSLGGAEPGPSGFISSTLLQIPGAPGETYQVSLTVDSVNGQLHEIGLFPVEGSTGALNGILPQHEAYPRSAFGETERQVLFSRRGLDMDTNYATFEGGQWVAVYVLQRGSPVGSADQHLHVNQLGNDDFELRWTELGPSVDPNLNVGPDATFLGSVRPINLNPSIVSTPPSVIGAESNYSYDATAVDPEGDELSFHLLAAPDGMSIDNASGQLRWASTYSTIGNHFIELEVLDEKGGFDRQTITLSVVDALPNRPPVITSDAISTHQLSEDSKAYLSEVVRFESWVPYQFSFDNRDDADWIVDRNAQRVQQTASLKPSMLLSDFELSNHRIEGTMQSDYFFRNGMTGIVFGYKDSQHFYLFEWNQRDWPNAALGPAFQGMHIKKYSSSTPLTASDLWQTEIGPEAGELLYSNDLAWDRSEYGISLEQLPGHVRITVTDDGDFLETIDLDIDGLEPGRVGFYTNEQAPTIFSDFTMKLLGGESYQYQVRATDADGDMLQFQLLESPRDMHIDEATGAISWQPTSQEMGHHAIVVQVTDGNGGNTKQEFFLCVYPEAGNASPQIVSAPITDYGFDAPTAYRYQVQAIDGDGDTLSFSLDEGPQGMRINRTTGEILWDKEDSLSYQIGYGLDGLRGVYTSGNRIPLSLSVSDGKGGHDSQSFDLFFTRSYPASIAGYVFEDLNHNRIPDSSLLQGERPTILFVVDSSQSMLEGTFSGEPLGDINRDDRFNTPFDAAVGGILTLAETIRRPEFSIEPILGVIDFRDLVDADPELDGVQTFTSLFADHDGDGNYDFDEAVRGLRSNTSVTNYEAALQRAVGVFETADSTTSNLQLVFLSDGNSNWGGDYLDEIDQLRAMGVEIEAFSIHQTASALVDLDPTPHTLSHTGLLSGTFTLQDLRGVELAEPGLANRTVYIDDNKNGYPDDNERQTLTDAAGRYVFEDLLPGTYTIRSVTPAGWTLTSPFHSSHEQVIYGAQDVNTVHFANERVTRDESGTPPEFLSLPDLAIGSGELFQYEALATDPDGSQVAYELVLGPSNATLDPTSGKLFWRPSSEDSGQHNFILRAVDQQNQSTSQAFQLTVASNSAPVITSDPPVVWPVGIKSDYQVTAFDAESDSFYFRTIIGPSDLDLDPDTGLLSWLPDDSPLAILNSDAPVGLWRFNEPGISNTVADSSGNGNDGITVDASIPKTSGPLGGEDTAALISGQDRTQYFGTEQSFPDKFTAELWVNPSDSAFGNMLGRPGGRDTARGFSLAIDGNSVSFSVNRSRIYADIPSDQWTHLVAIFDRPQLRLYVNGELVQEETKNTDFITNRIPLFTNGTGYAVDDIAFFDYSLSDQQIESHYARNIQNPRIALIEAVDEHGASSQHRIEMWSDSNHQNSSPRLQSELPERIGVGQLFVQKLAAADVDGGRLSYSLVAGPNGLTVDLIGTVQWRPSEAQLGENELTVAVSDSLGGRTEYTYTTEVVAQFRNQAPKIVSHSPGRAVVDELFIYKPQVIDDARGNLLWSLTESPVGMSINPTTGELAWVPSLASLGVTTVGIQVTDLLGDSDYQLFDLSVSCFNTQPQIVSIPSTSGLATVNYRYRLLAADVDGDPIAWSLLHAPQGMTVQQDGQLSWQPTIDQVGLHVIEVEASDGTSSTKQTYTLEIVDPDALVDSTDPSQGTRSNLAPVITSSPEYVAATGSIYSYAVLVTDPNGDDVAIEFGHTPPAGMQIDTNGLITWVPQPEQHGAHQVSITARDPFGLAVTQTYLLRVEPNLPPQFISVPPLQSIAGSSYRYKVQGVDPDGDQLRFELEAGPSGMTIDRAGLLTWRSNANELGDRPVSVRAIDSRGQTAVQEWQINLLGDSEPPRAGVSVQIGDKTLHSEGVVDFHSLYTVRVSGIDNVGVQNAELRVNGQLVLLDESGVATLQADTLGGVLIEGTVFDAVGLSATAIFELSVEDPANRNAPIPTDPTLPPHPGFVPSDTGVPLIEITSPEPASTVSNQVPIIGTVDDPEDNLWFYRVYFARADRVDLSALDMEDKDWVLLKTSTEEVIDGELAVFDSSLVSNDPYTIAVEAYDVNGRGFIQPTMVFVEGNVQVDNFRIDVTDLSIPLAGIPIQVTRTYDTLNSLDEGDFGFGWTLSIADPRIFEAAAVGAGGAFTPGNDKFVPGKTKVYLTNPAGNRVGFTYHEELKVGGLFGAMFRPYFVPDPGVYDELKIDETQVIRGVIGGDFGQGINPSHYTLVTKDGLEYRYDDQVGLETILDRTGNVLSVTTNGMQHSSGQSIEFRRDSFGRITNVIDPAGNAISYSYSAEGDLHRVTNQGGLSTRYTYRTDVPHYLDEAFDSLDQRVLEVRYDESGKFIGVEDALGNLSDQDFTTSGNSGVVRDALGNETTLTYDDRGNVLSETDASGNTTIREYSDPSNPDLETQIIDRNGNITERQYDSRGNLLSVVELGSSADPLATPIETVFAYDEENNVEAITNDLGFTTTFDYDANSQLIRITNAEGNASSFTYDEEGRRASFTDFNGNLTRFEYNNSCPCGSPSRVVFADGAYQSFQYNDFAQVTEEAWYESDGTSAEIRQTDFDELGRPVEERQGLSGNPKQPQTIVRKFYDGHRLDWEAVVHPDSLDSEGKLLESPATPIADRKSRITAYEYDAADRVIRQTDAEGGVVEFRYDANGDRILLRDPVGNITTWLYDSLGRVAEERDPFYNAGLSIEQAIDALATPSGADLDADLGADHVRVFGYDGEGNQVELIDRNGRRREFEYDQSSRLLNEFWYAADDGALVETIAFSYDSLGNTLTSSDSNSRYLYSYDSLNRMTSVDNSPNADRDVPRVILNYGYDAQGNVTWTQDDAGVTVESEYDSRNRLDVRKWFDADVAAGETADVDPIRVEFDYNTAGRESEIRRYSGLDTSNLIGRTLRTYDSVGRSDILNHVNAVDELLSGYGYDYDFGSLLEHEERTHQDGQYSQSIDYEYDLTGQLTDAYFSGQDDEHFEYDANGNRITSSLGSETSSYTTDVANQLSSDGTHRYEYDGEGNQIKRVHLTTGETRTMQYDHHNRLVRVDDWLSDPGDPNSPVAGAILTQTVEYAYDAHGRRIARSVDTDGEGPLASEKEFFVYNGDNVWADVDEAGASTTRYLFGNSIDSNIARFRAGEGAVWFLTDQLGTVRDLGTESGTILHHVDYQSFGTALSGANLLSLGRYMFTGREFDSAVGQSYFRARTYDPAMGHFVQRDPIAFDAGDLNLFRYVANSPMNGIDPTGLLIISAQAKFAAVAITPLVSTISRALILGRGSGRPVSLFGCVLVDTAIVALLVYSPAFLKLGRSTVAGLFVSRIIDACYFDFTVR